MTIEAGDIVDFTGGPDGMQGRALVLEVLENNEARLKCGSLIFSVKKNKCEIVFKGA